MTPDEALQLVAVSCARMMGTLDDHQRVQAALKVLDDIVHSHVNANGEAADVNAARE